jgi:hypothetical protein
MNANSQISTELNQIISTTINPFVQDPNQLSSTKSTSTSKITTTTTTNSCSPNPFNNGGLCTTSNRIKFTCFCLKGYSGMCLDSLDLFPNLLII